MDADSNGGQVKLNPTIDFIAGTIAGMTSLVVGFPFDTVKVRFQSPDIAHRYKSTLHAISTIVREERLVGLYKGISSPLATVALMNGLVFASYRLLMKLQLDHPNATPTLAQIALAGAGSGIISSIVTTPTELIKIRQQSLLTPTSARKVALQIYREAGLRGLYRGIAATALRDTGYGAYFFAYEATCRYFASPASGHPGSGLDASNIATAAEDSMNSLSWPALLLAGGLAGIFGWVATFPFDVVKTRMQGSESPHRHLSSRATTFSAASSSSCSFVTAGHNGNSSVATMTSPLLFASSRGSSAERSSAAVINSGNYPYRSMASTISHSYRTEGIGVFYRGLAPTLIRAVPVNMVTFATFEAVVHVLGSSAGVV